MKWYHWLALGGLGYLAWRTFNPKDVKKQLGSRVATKWAYHVTPVSQQSLMLTDIQDPSNRIVGFVPQGNALPILPLNTGTQRTTISWEHYITRATGRGVFVPFGEGPNGIQQIPTVAVIPFTFDQVGATLTTVPPAPLAPPTPDSSWRYPQWRHYVTDVDGVGYWQRTEIDPGFHPM